MKKFLLSFLFFSLTLGVSFGQRLPYFTHHLINPYIYNPAFAGYDKMAAVYLTHRQQWLGVEGAPVSTHLSFHSPVGNVNPISVGGDVVHDRLGVLRHSAVKLTAAYMLPLAVEKEHYLKFGLSGGVGLYQYDLQDADIGSDARLLEIAQNTTFLDARFGLLYRYERFTLGASVPSLLSPPTGATRESGGVTFDKFSYLIASANYRFLLSAEKNTVFEPTVLFHYNRDIESQVEALGRFIFNQSFWVGGGYQQQSGIAGLIGFKMKNLKFGYHYGIGGNELAGYSTGTHEVQLGLLIGKKKAELKRKPRLTTQDDSDIVPDAAFKKLKKRKRKKEKGAPEPQPIVSPEEKSKSFDDDTFKEVEQGIILSPTENQPTGSEEPPVQKEKTNEENSQENTTPTSPSAQTEQNKEVRLTKVKKMRSDHPLEMKQGSYVIAGTFSEERNARKLAQQLSDDGYGVKVGYHSEKGYYYVSLFASEDLEQVKSNLKGARSDKRLEKAWIMVVE